MRVTPVHLTKTAFSWRIMPFLMTYLLMKSRIQHYYLSTSKHDWRSNIGYILYPTFILTPRYAGILFAYHDGNSVKIFKRVFILLSSHLIPQGGTAYSLIIIMTFNKCLKKLQKGSRVTPGHYDCPL